jgi:predicted  nucleic acid-binding Zn-ribbon protein
MNQARATIALEQQMRELAFTIMKLFKLLPFAVLVAIFWHHQGNFRKFLPISYKASSSEIEQLAISTTMTPKARQLFYRNDPKIVPKHLLPSLCQKPERVPQRTIHLGCYIRRGDESSIVLQSVTDPRLQGLTEVAAAHEMLHAAYEELSPAERSRLSPKLRQSAQQVKAPHLLPVLQAYEAGNPETYTNELHSYLGTELANLGDPDLEKHYQQYFHDRQQVLALAQRANSTLTQLEETARQLKQEIETLEASLKDQQQSIQQADQNLGARFQNLEKMKSELSSFRQQAESSSSQSGSMSLISQFELEKDRLNAEVNQHNLQSQALQQKVSQFNQAVETYKQKVSTYNELVNTNRSILDSLIVREPEPTVHQISP